MAYHLGCMAANSSKTLAKRNNGKHVSIYHGQPLLSFTINNMVNPKAIIIYMKIFLKANLSIKKKIASIDTKHGKNHIYPLPKIRLEKNSLKQST